MFVVQVIVALQNQKLKSTYYEIFVFTPLAPLVHSVQKYFKNCTFYFILAHCGRPPTGGDFTLFNEALFDACSGPM